MTLCQRTNAGYAASVARWLAVHHAELRVDDALPDSPVRYWLVPAGADDPRTGVRFRTPREFGRAIETPGALTCR